MVIALVVVAVLLFVAVVLLSNAFGSVATETSIRAKIAAFDAAEAGINEVIDVLDRNHGFNSDCVDTGEGHTVGTLADGGTSRGASNITGSSAEPVRSRITTTRSTCRITPCTHGRAAVRPTAVGAS